MLCSQGPLFPALYGILSFESKHFLLSLISPIKILIWGREMALTARAGVTFSHTEQRKELCSPHLLCPLRESIGR